MTFIQYLLDISVLLFPIASMLAVGLSFSFFRIIRPLRFPDRVFRAIVANFILVPLLAIGISRLLELDQSLAAGMILVGTAAGAPFLLKLTAVANAEVRLSASMLLLLMPLTIVYMPLVVPQLITGTSVNASAIAISLALTMLLPLSIGHATDSFLPRLAARLVPIVSKISNIALLTLIISTIVLNGSLFWELGLVAILAVVLLTIGGFLMGYLISSKGFDRRAVMGLGAGQRNIAAALVVASQDLSDPKTLSMIVLFSVVDLMVLFPVAIILRRSSIPLQSSKNKGSSTTPHGSVGAT